MTVTLDATLFAVLLAGAVCVGALVEQVLAERSARSSCICPTCLGPTDESGTWRTDR